MLLQCHSTLGTYTSACNKQACTTCLLNCYAIHRTHLLRATDLDFNVFEPLSLLCRALNSKLSAQSKALIRSSAVTYRSFKKTSLTIYRLELLAKPFSTLSVCAKETCCTLHRDWSSSHCKFDVARKSLHALVKGFTNKSRPSLCTVRLCM